MKQITIGLIAMVIAIGAEAQTWDEWFKQKKTQKEYLIKQIAALKVYLECLKEGYDVAKKGLTIIGDVRDGNFDDHSTYFGSLKLVSPKVKGTSKIGLITSYHAAIMRDFRTLRDDCRKYKILTAEEVRYVESVYNNLITECEKSIDALIAVVTDNSFQMQDDERVDRIEIICEDMKDKYLFCRSFCNSTRVLMMQRSREQAEIRTQGILNSGS